MQSTKTLVSIEKISIVGMQKGESQGDQNKSGNHLYKKRNSSGPSTDPWGTQQKIWN